MNIRRIIYFLLGIIAVMPLSAQQVSGRLVSSDMTAVPYANVVLQQPDSTFVTGCTTDHKGLFSLQASQPGDYRLVLSYIGYETLYITLNQLQGKVKLGDVTIEEVSNQMNEVVVTGSSTVRKADRQVVVPSLAQMQSSATSYDLLNKLMLPGLAVDPVQHSVSTVGGGSVELRINDMKASKGQLLALNAKDVLRVEYIDNPGIRYGDTDVAAVINYVMKAREAGVSGGVLGSNAITYPGSFGDNNIYVYANKGLSEIGIDYYPSYRNYDHRHSDETQTFDLGNESTRSRVMEGVDVPFGYWQHTIEGVYTLNMPDKFLFRALFTDEIFKSSNNDKGYLMHETNQPDIYSFTHAKILSQTPSLDLYAAWDLPRNQKLMLNAVGTYIGSDYLRDYQESLWQSGESLSEYNYTTDGNRYSLIGEGIYRKEWEKTTFSVGVKGMTAYTHNVYEGTNNSTYNQHSNSLYGYAELQGDLGKLHYQVGAGVSKNEYSLRNEGYSFVTFRPQVSLFLPLFKGANVRYTFQVTPSSPSLAQLSEVTQQLTTNEINLGNKDLVPYRRYINQLAFNWQFGRFSMQLSGNYRYYNHPIMEQIERQGTGTDALFVYTYANQDKFTRLGGNLNLRWSIVPDRLTLSLNGSADRYQSKGTHYDHHFKAYSGSASLNYTQGSFSLSAGGSTRDKSLWGETISYDQTVSYLGANYRIKSILFGLNWSFLFQPQGWKAGSRLISDLVQKKNWTLIKENGNMICFYFNWSFSSGRKYNSGKKVLNNADRESGIVQ